MTSDYFATIEAGAAKRRAERDARLSAPCPMPRCRAQVGVDCTTPNGWLTYHKARERAVRGEQPRATARRHRLTEAQAERVEIAAQHGHLYAPGQHAQFGGDAAERAVADALERHGLVEQVSADEYGERTLRLTAAGWRAYWHDRKVIRRLPEDQHSATCPCVAELSAPGGTR